MTQDFKEVVASQKVSDIHIKCYDPMNSVVYPKQKQDNTSSMSRFFLDIKKTIEDTMDVEQNTDFLVEFGGVSFRGAVVETVSGSIYTLRLLKDPLELDSLSVSELYKSTISSRKLNDGGLVIITGLPGSGKTTICVASLIYRLKKYGGICYTVEDPPEIPFQGDHGDGICFQTDISSHGGFKDSIKNLLRAYPSQELGMLFVGEIRDSGSAEQTLLAALSGRLVFATMHAGSQIDAVKRMISLAAEKIGEKVARELLSKNLIMCVNQKLKRNKLTQDFFINNMTISSLISSGSIDQIASEIESQEIKRRINID